MSGQFEKKPTCYLCGEAAFDRCDPCWKPICHKHHYSFPGGLAIYCPKCYRGRIFKDRLGRIFSFIFYWGIGWYLLPNSTIPFKDYTLETFLRLLFGILFFLGPWRREIDLWIEKARKNS
jgi:hypothetical protein